MTDLQVRTFADLRVRPFCDRTMQLYYAAQKFIQDYDSQGIAAKIAVDGASTPISMDANDGRSIITGQDVTKVYQAAGMFVAYMEGGAVAALDRRAVIDKPSVNGLLGGGI